MLSLPNYPFTPILGWSHSRYSTFDICKRKYFYQYYKKFDDEIDVRLIAELINLKTIPLAIGDLTHQFIRTIIYRTQNDQSDIDRTELSKYVTKTTEDYLRGNPFLETKQGRREEIAIEELIEPISEMINQFIDSKRYEWIRKNASASDTGWLVDPPGYGETRIDGIKCYIKIDFLFTSGDQANVFDWKTGEEKENHLQQLTGYVAWINKALKVKPENIRPFIAYLKPNYREITKTYTEFEISAFSQLLAHQTNEMQGYCTDVEENVPLEKSSFEKIDNMRICSKCNFESLCYPEANP